jgi:hypothetical protein
MTATHVEPDTRVTNGSGSDPDDLCHTTCHCSDWMLGDCGEREIGPFVDEPDGNCPMCEVIVAAGRACGCVCKDCRP